MKNKRGNVAIIAVIIVVVAITAGVVGWMFAKKTQAPTPQTVTTQPTAPIVQTQPAVQPTTPATQPSAKSAPADENASLKTYASTKYGFEFQYPEDWVIGENEITASTDTVIHWIGIGDVASISGGMRWGINVYNSNEDIDEIISKMGTQFNDRQEKKESITIGGRQATKTTITTSEIKDWVSEQIVVQKDNKLFVIDNGAVKDSKFDLFVSTFKFTK